MAIPVAIVWTIREAARAGIFGPTAAAAAHNARYTFSRTHTFTEETTPANNDPQASPR